MTRHESGAVITEQEAEAVVGVFLSLLQLALFPVQMVLHGVVVTWLWQWFIVPMFNWPALSIPSAIGLSLTTHYLTGRQPRVGRKTSYEEQLQELLSGFMFAILVLVSGWIVSAFL